MAASRLVELPPNYGNLICSTQDCHFPLNEPNYHTLIGLLVIDANSNILVMQEQFTAFLQNITVIPYLFVRKPYRSFEWLIGQIQRRLNANENTIKVLRIDPILKELSIVRFDQFALQTFSEASLQIMGLMATQEPIFVRLVIFLATYSDIIPKKWTPSPEPKVIYKATPMNDIWCIPNARLRRGLREAIKKFRKLEIQTFFPTIDRASKFASTCIWESLIKGKGGNFNFSQQVKMSFKFQPRKNGPSLTLSLMHVNAKIIKYIGRPHFVGLMLITKNLKILFSCNADDDYNIKLQFPKVRINFDESQNEAIQRIIEHFNIPVQFMNKQKILRPLSYYNPMNNRLESISIHVFTFNRIVNIGHNIVTLNFLQIKNAIRNERLKKLIFECLSEAQNYAW